jgi:hypothetical protein
VVDVVLKLALWLVVELLFLLVTMLLLFIVAMVVAVLRLLAVVVHLWLQFLLPAFHVGRRSAVDVAAAVLRMHAATRTTNSPWQR